MIVDRNTPTHAMLPEPFLAALVALASNKTENGPQAATRLMEYLSVLGFSTNLTFDLSNPILAVDEVTALVEEIRAFMRTASRSRQAA